MGSNREQTRGSPGVRTGWAAWEQVCPSCIISVGVLDFYATNLLIYFGNSFSLQVGECLQASRKQPSPSTTSERGENRTLELREAEGSCEHHKH